MKECRKLCAPYNAQETHFFISSSTFFKAQHMLFICRLISPLNRQGRYFGKEDSSTMWTRPSRKAARPLTMILPCNHKGAAKIREICWPICSMLANVQAGCVAYSLESVLFIIQKGSLLLILNLLWKAFEPSAQQIEV